MSFTYDFTNSPDISTVRLLVSDTDSTQPIFQDAEVNAALNLFSSQGIIIGLAGFAPATPVTQIYSYRRAAAVLLNALAADKARLGAVVGALDFKINAAQAATALRDLAQSYINQEELDGYFAVSEMVQDSFSMRERLWKQLYRTQT